MRYESGRLALVCVADLARAGEDGPRASQAISEVTYHELDRAVHVLATGADAKTWKVEVAMSGFVRGSVEGWEGLDVVVIAGDTWQDVQRSRRDADHCSREGAKSVWIWTLPGLYSRHPTLADWVAANDLAGLLEAERARGWGGFVSFVSDPRGVGPKFEGEPRPIATELVPVPSMDPSMIPGPFRDWCLDIAERVCCPLEYVAAPLMVALSGLVGRRLAIRPKRADDWKVIPNLWGAIVGPPGSLKTPAIDEVCRPIKAMAAAAERSHREALAEHQQGSMVSQALRTAARKAMDTAARKGEDEGRLRELAREVRERGGDEAPPEMRRYLLNDVTNEKLGELMSLEVNRNGLTLFRDELVGFFRTLERPGHEADKAFYLESWNGTGSFTFDRIGRGTIHIPCACLALFGGIQPGPLSSYLRGTFSGEECDGFIQRFQVMMYPDRPSAFRNVDRPPDQAAKHRAWAVFEALDALEPTKRGCPVEDETGIPHLRFDREAQDFFDAWRVNLEGRLLQGTLSGVMTSHLSKYRSLLPSLALIFHLVETYERPSIGPVTLRAAKASASWCELLEAHARRIYGASMEGDPDLAVRLSERLSDSLPNPFTCRDVSRKCWAGLASSEDVRKAVALLEDRNWVKVVDAPPTERGGRPTEQIWVHPAVLRRATP